METLFGGECADFDSDSRLLLIATHPDDETLGCGVVLQRAVRAGAAIQVVYATDGDNNPWPQRLIDRKWRLDANDRKRWAKLRRAEALDALRVLGVRASDVRFLGLPDQGLTDILRRDCRSTLERFTRIINNWSPTHLLIPSVGDTHPDHNALAVILRLVLTGSVAHDLQMSVWNYAIHGKNRSFFQRSQQIRQSEAETKAKAKAIRCHKTQLKLSRRRFLAYATCPERFVRLSSCEPALIYGSIRSITKKSRTLHLDLQFPLRAFGVRTPRVFLFGYDSGETLRCVAIQVAARTARVEMRDVASGNYLGTAEYRGNVFGGELTIPTNIFSLTHPLFVKVERRRYGFSTKLAGSPVTLNAPQAQFVYSDSVPAKIPTQAAGSAQAPRRWAFLFVVVLVWLAAVLSADIDRPWIGAIDYNGAVWSQSAHNILRAGLAETLGASSGFYFSPLPIPAWGYYLHHPPLLHLLITALFAVFGEHEWVARLLPIGCSLTSVVLLWLLVRSCVGARTATLSAAVFASLPMALRYGQMVNFEPCVLMLILGALLCLRYWSVSGKARWRHAALGLILVGLWVDWAMYIFVGSLCICWLSRSRDTRSFAKGLILAASFSAACYFIRIQLLRPDAWQNLAHTLIVRLGYSGMVQFTELQWLERVLGSLVVHFLPLGWVLAAAGALAAFRARRYDKNLLWLFRACVCVCVMDAFFVGVFQNDSYIHHYLSFYFLAPVAIMAGIALDRLITFFQINFTMRKFALLGELLTCAIVVAMGTHGIFQTTELQRQFRILDHGTPEPPNLIPDLGTAIREDFPPGTRILCNFLPEYGPQFAYYAQREILNNLSDYRTWQRYLNDSGKPVGGVVWMGSKSSHDLIAKLPRGSKRFLRVGNLSFCLWKRNQATAKRRLTEALD
jgi:LmbE family N-acetylglucosaminyl deacetylase/4-amino-4-deoxy-L-arabinose transferase-like glycosyltransferase